MMILNLAGVQTKPIKVLEYLFRKKSETNKEMMRLYVALTRSKSDLVLVVDESSIRRKNKSQIDDEFKKMGISYISMEYMKEIAN